MNKRIVYVVIVIVVVGLLIALFAKISSTGVGDVKNIASDISAEVKSGSVSSTGLTLIITDLVGDEESVISDSDCTIHKKDGDIWRKVDELDDYNSVRVLPGTIYTLDENNSFEMEINWKSKYGKLNSGDYRIIISANTYGDVVTEFTIE